MKNNNTKIVGKLSKRSLKHNQMRNVIAIAAIALTSLLFTALFSLGSGLVQLSQEETMRQIGSRAHGGFKAVTQAEYEKLIDNPLIRDSGYNIFIGSGKNEQLKKRQTEIRYVQPANLKFGFAKIKEGKLPEQENEAVIDTIVLDMLQVPHEVGQKVMLEFNFLGKEYQKEFVLSGWYEGDPVGGASTIYIAEQFMEKIKNGWTDEGIREYLKENTANKNGDAGLYQVNIMFKNSMNIEKNIKQVVAESGLLLGDEHIAVNWAYMSQELNNLDAVSVILLIVVFLVMMLTGFLIIYNIFKISILSDIRFYGLLKTIGTTKKQIKTLVKKQAVFLSVIGIPIGLLLGFIVGKMLLPITFNITNGNSHSGFSLQAKLWVFLFGAFFSLVTVIISCRQPSKIAGSVSPIEALKYAEESVSEKKTRKVQKDPIIRKNKRKTNGAKIYKMAFTNLSRNKKKTTIVILSMSLSVILLTEIVTLVKSFSLDAYLESKINGDFMISTTDFLYQRNGVMDFLLPEDYYEAVRGQDGVLQADSLYHCKGKMTHPLSKSGHEQFVKLYAENKLDIREHNKEQIENTRNNNAPIFESRFAYDERLLEKLEVLEGKLDLKKFESGNYILVSSLKAEGNGAESYYKPGDKVTLNFAGPQPEYKEIKDAKGNIIDYQIIIDKQKEYEVMAVVKPPYSMTERRFGLNELVTIMPTAELLKMDSRAERFAASFLVEDNKEAAVQQFLETYTTKIDPNTAFESKEAIRVEFTAMMNAIQLIGGALAFVIAIVGILNFINTMLTSVITRKREFAMLQSIGLTNAQLKKLLLYEGIYYVAFTAILSFTLGSLLSVTAVNAFNNIVLYFNYRFTLLPFLGTIPVFLVIAFIVPLIAYGFVSKHSIVERLREE